MDGRGIEGDQSHVPGKDKAIDEGAGMKACSKHAACSLFVYDCQDCQKATNEQLRARIDAMPLASSVQVGGSHYKDKAIQPWDYIISNGLGYLEGNIVKYVSRYKDKNGLEDLEKARHYLDKLIETQEAK